MKKSALFFIVSSYCIVKKKDGIAVAQLLILGMLMGCVKLEVVAFDDQLFK